MKRYGQREVANVVFRAKSDMKLGNRKIKKDEPVIYFDTLKTSGLETATQTVYAQGGMGNPRLIAWEGDKTLTLTMEDALLSAESMALLNGSDIVEAKDREPIFVHTTDTKDVKQEGQITVKLEPSIDEKAGIYVMQVDPDTGVMVDGVKKIDSKDVNGKVITIEGAKVGDVYMADFYVEQVANAKEFSISPKKFAGNFYIEGETLVRNEDGTGDDYAQFIIPNGKVQTSMNWAMSNSGDPSTFTFTIEAFPATTKFNKTDKVLACMQIVDPDVGE